MMETIKRLLVSNAMLLANLLAIFGSSLISYILTENISPHDQQILGLGWEGDEFLEWVYFIVVGGLTFLYELPIRRALKLMPPYLSLDPALALKARQRLLNEPYIIAAIDFVIWTIAGLAVVIYLISAGVPPLMALLEGLDMLLTAIITVTIVFFLLQFIIQKWLAPMFFPQGRLSAVPGTQKTALRKTLLNLSLALNFIPLSIIGFTHLAYTYKLHGTFGSDTAIGNLNAQIMVLSLTLVGVGVLLTLIVSRNLSRPLMEITQVLEGVGRGNFDAKVRVTTNDEIGYTGDVINTMTAGLKERERLRQSLSVAQEVQQLLLPGDSPNIEGLDIAGKSIYSEETGGDYYDFLGPAPGKPGEIGIVVGDVTGHGIGSALLMSTARAFIRLRSMQPGSLSQIVNDVNRELSNDVGDSGRFMTLFYLAVDKNSRSLKWVRAGHEPAIIYDAQGDTFDELHGPGVPLGVDADWEFEAEQERALMENQIILIATDGIWEAQNPEGRMFGKEPIYDMIRQNATASAHDILERIFRRLVAFHGHRNIADDVTLVIIKT